MNRLQSRLFSLFSMILLSLIIVHSAYAADTREFYEASVKVETGKSENDLIADAFTRVLVKVSGRSDVAAAPGYQAMLGKARGAISQFRYDHKIIVVDGAQDAEPEKEKWFWVRFNAKTVDELLKEADLPIWGKVRPETLIWFSQEVKSRRFLHSQHDEPEIYTIFEQQADARGISLIFPFLDLQDRSSLSTTDIWGNFNDSILLASRRYQAQATVTVRLFKERSGLWVSQWNLLMLGNVQSWELRDDNKERILTAGIDELADKLARQFTQKTSDASEYGILVQVNNVSGFKAFLQLDDYLRNLATVKSAVLVQLNKDEVIYNINYLGDKNALIQEIRLGDMLNPVERSRVDYGDSGNDGKDYQAVILGDLNKKDDRIQVPEEKSAREKALDSMNADKNLSASEGLKDDSKGTDPEQQQANAEDQEAIIKKPVERLIPELEYWLVR